MSSRIACVWIPRFSLTVLRPTIEPKRPSALYRPDGRWREVLECDPILEAAGLRPGTPLKEAQARWSEAAFIPRDEERARRAFVAVVDALDQFSPAIEPAGPGLAYLDAAGLEGLYGGDVALAAQIRAAVAELGFTAVVGIADDRFTAMVAARRAGTPDLLPTDPPRAGVPAAPAAPLTPVGPRAPTGPAIRGDPPAPADQATKGGRSVPADPDTPGGLPAPPATHPPGFVVVPPGGSAAFLAPLPIALLPLPATAFDRLRDLGLATIGEFASLPPNSIVQRWGDAGRQALAAARGRDRMALKPLARPLLLQDTLELEWQEESRDRLLFLLKTLVDRLSRRLARHGLVCARLHVRWLLADDGEQAATLHLAEPSADPAELTEHLRWHVEGLTLTSAVAAIELTAAEVVPAVGRQLELPGEDDLAAGTADRWRNARRAIARLVARWGVAVVRQATLTAERRPEQAFRWREPDLLSATGEKKQTPTTSPTANSPTTPRIDLPLWLHDPPLPARLRRWRGVTVVRFAGRIVRIDKGEGPWRLIEGQWNHLLREDDDPGGAVGLPAGEGIGETRSPIDRDYFQVTTVDGQALLLFRERDSQHWYVQGEYA